MNQPREARQRKISGICAIFLELALLISFQAMTHSDKAYGRTGNLISHSIQEQGGAGNEKDIPILEQGKPINRELAGGQQHTYQIKLNPNQFLKVAVVQKDIDLVAEVSGPDGQHIFEFDSEYRGPEEIVLVAEAEGYFHLIVRPSLDRAVAGSYEILVEELRDATDRDRALHDARKQYEESRKLENAGKYDEALPLGERALEIRERILGAEDRDVADAIASLAGIFTGRGEYVKAEPLYRRALGIREKVLGKDHLDTGFSLNDLATLYYYQGNYQEAEPLFKSALEIQEKVLGKDHPAIAEILSNLGVIYFSQGKYGEAEPLYQRALEIFEKYLGKDHWRTAASLSNLAQLYREQGKYEEAEPLYLRALDIRERVRGKDHTSTAINLDELAELYREQGKFKEAEPLYQRALEIYEKVNVDHPNTAIFLNNLALLYLTQGRYEEAEPLYKRSLGINEKVLGKDHPLTANSLINLASLYDEQGRYHESEPLYQRAIAVCEKALGKDHPETAGALNNLALLYQTQGNYAAARPLYQRALKIFENALGKDHPSTATSLDNLAALYYHQGRYGEAEPLFKRALAIREKALGKDHPDTAHSLINLALLNKSQGRYSVAEPLYQRALAILEETLGKDHPTTAATLDRLATLYAAKGDLVQAMKYQARANTAGESNLARNLVIGSEHQKLAYLATSSETTDQTISLHLHDATGDPVAGNLAATIILQRKGRALDATSQNLNALRSRFDSEDRSLLDRLTETREQIASLALRKPQGMTAERQQARIKALENQAELYESEIGRRSKEFRAQYLPVTLEAVRAAIPPDAAVLEYALYRPFNARAAKDLEVYGQPHYAAYVLRRDGEIRWKDLGETKAIDQAIAALRTALRNETRLDVKRLARTVDARIFSPLRPLLGDVRQLLISPDGSLNLIPFAALVDERGRYAVDRYSISYLTSGRDLLRLQVESKSKDGPLLVAGPDFGSRTLVAATRSIKKKDLSKKVRIGSGRTANIDELYFPPLPETVKEGEALRAILPGATLLSKRQATKSALKLIHGPRLLHIATHGFFLQDQNLTSASKRGNQPLNVAPKRFLKQVEEGGQQIENPLLRSGLVLAGANEHKEDDNGILTALEVTGLNLWGTKLVVLSACDTGVGEVKNGDGVYGLRRALVLAGAETQMMSLWAVSDKATRELMVAYYRRLQQGEGRSEALRHVQLEMLKAVNRRHPFYWASFILSGEWAKLD